MPTLPIYPHLKNYRGADPKKTRKVDDANRLAHKIARHLNEQILKNPSELQQHFFGMIAIDLGCHVDAVRSALSDGGYNGITLRATTEDRENIRRALGVKDRI